MHRFVVVLQDEVVGTSDLEWLDSGMGVGYGRFYPRPAYVSIPEQVVMATEARHAGKLDNSIIPPLELRSAAGERIETSFVTIEDYGDESPNLDLEIAAQFSERDQYERARAAG
jgi:hypothetical protein